MGSDVHIDEALLEVLRETDLINFERKLAFELQLTRLEHFNHVSDKELKAYLNISLPAIRRLRLAIADKKKKVRKSKSLFSTISKRSDAANSLVLAQQSSGASGSWIDSLDSATCLISRDEIRLMEKLGEGTFAVVKRGVWKQSDDKSTDVAVKILRDSTAEVIHDLQVEVHNMQKMKHPNLIRLYGIVFSTPAMMIVEFCNGGSLIDRIRSQAKPVPLVSTLLDYVQQISKGMAYLESRNCVHRDLAARNILLCDNERTVKICDFGLMRILEGNDRLYVMTAKKKVPFAWCPPESLRYRQFSHSSDVWAFGVTMWELFSYGEEPWIGFNASEVLSKLESGERLQRPSRCSCEIYDLISNCWSGQVENRPRFTLLKAIIADIKFMIAECRELYAVNEKVDMEMAMGDGIIIIDGSGDVWFGQNIRTHKFGHFLRSCIRARNTLSNESSGLSLVHSSVIRNDRVSKPIPGSFIHAGHGDINAQESWGQPDRIDDIYLRNPILRSGNELPNQNARRRIGPEMITSVIDLTSSHQPENPSTLASKMNCGAMANQSSNYFSDTESISSLDPFAPFSEYYEGLSCGTKAETPCNLAVYDQPPSTSSQCEAVSCAASLFQQQQQSRSEPLSLKSTKRPSSAYVVPGHAPPPIRSADFIPQIYGSENVVCASRNSVHPTLLTPFSDHCSSRSLGSMSVDEMNCQANANLPLDQNGIARLSVLSHGTTKLSISQLPLTFSGPLSTPLQRSNDGLNEFENGSRKPDPFEVSSVVKKIATRESYSQIFMNSSTDVRSGRLLSNSAASIDSSERHLGFLDCSKPSAILNSSGSATSLCQFRPPYYWQPGSQFLDNYEASLSRAIKPSLIYNVSNGASSSCSKEPIPNRLIAGHSVGTADRKSSHMKQGIYCANDDVISMFDPLVQIRFTNEYGSNQNCLQVVIDNAKFAGRQRCENMLRNCQNNAVQAISELKIDELLSMGIAKNRTHAKAALEDCDWNLNDAAAALLS